MSNHTTMIEKAFHAANTALGTDPKYPKPLTDALKRRDAAEEIMDYRPMNVAQELAAAPNPRQWPSVLDKCAAHNARAEQAQAAIRGGLLSSATAQLDHQLKQYVPEYTTSVYKTVEAHLNALLDAAQDCPTTDAEAAINSGYGDALTQLHKHAVTIRAYVAVGTVTAPGQRPAQAAHALALVTDPGQVNVIKRTPASRWNQGGELRSPEADIRRRDIARGLIGDWLKNETETLRRLGRGEYEGFSLSPATADTYTERVEQLLNSDRIERVAD